MAKIWDKSHVSIVKAPRPGDPNRYQLLRKGEHYGEVGYMHSDKAFVGTRPAFRSVADKLGKGKITWIVGFYPHGGFETVRNVPTVEQAKGWGSAVMDALLERINAEGSSEAVISTNQPFLKRILDKRGFNYLEDNVWHKKFSRVGHKRIK